jgi:hypothetical protein
MTHGSENVIIASNIGRIGKKADAEDLKVTDWALAIVFPYKSGDDKAQFEKRAETI